MKGKRGENAAANLFKRLNWQMAKTEPPTRITRRIGRGRFEVVFTSKGQADFTGYRNEKRDQYVYNGTLPVYTAVEVKEAPGDRMPASRLSKEQRAIMESLPAISARVAIYWTEYAAIELFIYKYKGSYKRGAGLESQTVI